MNYVNGEPSKKRLRQSSIIECFGENNCKKNDRTVQNAEINTVLECEQSTKMETTEDHMGDEKPESQTKNVTESPELFTSDYDETPPLFVSDSPGGNNEATSSTALSLGTPIRELKRTPQCAASLPTLKSCNDHTVLFKTDSKFDSPPKPSLDYYTDKWDENHVRMPCSPSNLYPVGQSKESELLESRWDLIRRNLNEPIKSSYDLQKAIVTYNNRYAQKSAFKGLHVLFSELLSPEESDTFFETILPRMVRLALQLPYLCTQPIPLLKQKMNHTITLSQIQVACLMANAFFCTFPRRSQTKYSEYRNYPSINFMGLYSSGGKGERGNRKYEKLKCLINYFRRVTSEEPRGTISFKRQCIDTFPEWAKSDKTVPRLHITQSGTIETEGVGMLQMDFANRFIGGGVLCLGCVQEEIRFIICPELIVSRLFTEQMDVNECVLITGCEQFCKYNGYGDSFQFAGNVIDTTPSDAWGRKYTKIVALDAKSFRCRTMQYNPEWLRREVNKAYCGFYQADTLMSNLEAVATGNWGCGVYHGDPRLKALLQLIAAAEAGRDVTYFTFGDAELCHDIYKMHSFLTEKQIATGNLWSLIESYHSGTCTKLSGSGLYEHIRRLCKTTSYSSDTDVEG